jgi:hypothetical protein
MIRELALLSAPDLVVHRVDHDCGGEHQDPEEESARAYSITFVERGSFSVHSRHDSGELHAGDVFITHPGDVYSCRHTDAVPEDVCLTVSWRRAAIEGDSERASIARAQRRRILPANNRIRYLAWRV